MNKQYLIGLATLITCFPKWVLSDTLISDSKEKIGSPSISAPVAADNALQVHASGGSSNVTLKISSKESPVGGEGDFRKFSLIVQAPISKGDSSSTTFATLDGLANNTYAELKITDTLLSGRKKQGEETLAYCDQHNFKDLFVQLHPKDADKFLCDIGTAKGLLVASKISDTEYDNFKRTLYEKSAHIQSWGASGKVGYSDLSYFDSQTLGKTDVRRTPWSIGGFYAFGPFLSADIPMVYAVTLNVQSAYKDAKSKTVCLPPMPGSALLTCASGAIGAPTNKTTEILNLEWRARWTPKIGTSLVAARDFRNKVSGLQIPIYFVPGEKAAGLTGGISYGWTSETHKSSIGVFIGQAFSLFQ